MTKNGGEPLIRSYQAQLPTAVRLRAEAQGATGRQWLASLDEKVTQLADQWDLAVGELLSGGSASLVARVRLANDQAAVLKIGLPGAADLAVEAKVYRLAAGRGYAKLLGHDPQHNALLLERLGPPLSSTVNSSSTQIQLICHTLQAAWLPLASAHGLMTGAQKAAWLAAFISAQWPLLGRPCAKTTVDQALAFTEERAAAYNPATAVLVHGDAHADNTLMIEEPANDEALRCKFVDPEGLFAEPACDLAVPMRDWSYELLTGDTLRRAQARCELLARLTGVAERAIWQWGFMERVSTGLVLLEIGQKSEGQATLAVADRLNTAY